MRKTLDFHVRVKSRETLNLQERSRIYELLAITVTPVIHLIGIIVILISLHLTIQAKKKITFRQKFLQRLLKIFRIITIQCHYCNGWRPARANGLAQF